jgi:hypothetical protein
MKIGFVVHFFDFRNDVRRVIGLVAQKHDVVLFVRQLDIAVITQHLPANVEVRIVQEENKTPRNRLATQSFRFFGKLPRSRQNFFLMEMFKIQGHSDAAVRTRAGRALRAVMQLPKFIDYDTYLSWLTYRGETDIGDIDRFILFTEISDSYFLARLLKEKKDARVYVYSWDHPCKQQRFSRRVQYLVWNEGIRQDMAELQDIDSATIKVVGASQFAFVEAFNQLPEASQRSLFGFEYIYFGCAVGIPDLAVREIEVIRRLSVVLRETRPDLKLVVRAYPNMGNWQLYQPLTVLDNVVLDDGFRSADLSISEQHILEKFVKIHFAQLFIHLGTTLGFEACFTGTPSVILDFPDFRDGTFLSIYNFVHQYQNEKYLLLEGYENVVRSEAEFGKLISGLRTPGKRESLLRYNQQVRNTTRVKSFTQFSEDLVR